MKKFENFCRALENLNDAYRRYEEPYDNVVLTGLTSLYGICFEQARKAMKEILEYHGFGEGKTGSPRQVLKTAYQAGMIRAEKLWLDALDDRNHVAHAYNKELALQIVRAVKKDYMDLFEAFKNEIEGNWL